MAVSTDRQFELKLSGLEHIDYSDEGTKSVDNIQVEDAFKRLLTYFQDARKCREETWERAWSMYLAQPESTARAQHMARHAVGNVTTNWRHRITTSKTFEIVETINSYLQAAFFPFHNWIALTPTQPIGEDYKRFLKVITAYIRSKLRVARFEDYWDMFTRQLIITGTSVLMLPWTTRYGYRVKNYLEENEVGDLITAQKVHETVDYDNFEFEVLNMFDTWLDPDSYDHSPTLIRRYYKTRAQLYQLAKTGQLEYLKVSDINKLVEQETRDDTIVTLNENKGMNLHNSPKDMIPCYELWGDLTVGQVELKDVVAVFVGRQLVSLRQNPFWDGKPFIVGSYIPMIDSPYGISALEASLGNLHIQDVLQNQRLDIIETTINPMFEVLNDGSITDLSEVYSYPGRVYAVSQPGTIRPIPRDMNVSPSYQEEQSLENRIDKATGIGNYLGVNTGRSGERVTAEEVRISREAGGSRLSRVHKHIEDFSLSPTLQKIYHFMQQFVVDDMVRIASDTDPDVYEYIKVGINELSHDMIVRAYGADYVSDREYETRQIMDFINVSAGIEMISSNIDWKEITEELASRFLHDDHERFLKKQEEQPMQPGVGQAGGLPPQQPGLPQQPPGDPMAALLAEAQATGGQPLQNALATQLQNDPTSLALNAAQGLGMANPNADAALDVPPEGVI